MNDLKQWAKDNAKFIKLGDEECQTFVFERWMQVADQQDPDKQKIRYYLKCQDNVVRSLDSASGAFAEKMADFVGKTIEITRKGLGTNTKYDVKEVLWD